MIFALFSRAFPGQERRRAARGCALGPQSGGERSEEEEEEVDLGWFPPALETNLSLQEATRWNLK